MKPDKIIPFPLKPVPPKAELDAGEPLEMQGVGGALLASPASCANIINVEFDRDEYVVCASPAV